MKKLTGLLALLAIVVVMSGCASSWNSSAGKINSGIDTRAHGWETPHFTSDLGSNPVKSELGLGFVTVGSQAGFNDHPDGDWVSFDVAVGPS